ncbi:polysaccharide pyruvyl transferase family protein [Gorillibacterium timonense]|uniref:polysaccharide pyruvyl transferase family protein n=1 Tax=Gorillibacterium timonense TaxID=1689269 RepID=UPI00071E0913|nr:polysaccharide pyruvyl transferase family protein [Gorillibacterium timonense]
MKIGVCGYYGMGNFGDELFLLTFRQQLAGHQVVAWHPSFDPEGVDAVLIGGGDLITPYSFNSYYFPAKLQAKPAWVYGVGIVDAYPESTWPDSEVEKYRRFLRGTQGLYLRDERSAAIARRIGLHSRIDTVPDPVFAYRSPGLPLHRPSRLPTIGVCVHAYPDLPAARLASILGKVSSEGYHILLIPVVNHSVNPYTDYKVCKDLTEHLLAGAPQASVAIFKPEYELELVYSVIQSCDYLISFKLHPALAALRGLVPTFCVSKQGKVSSLLSRFGLQDFLQTDEKKEDALEEGLRRLLREGKERFAAAEPLIRQTEREAETALVELRREMEVELEKN